MADIVDLIARPPAFDFRTLADPFQGYMQGRDMRSQIDTQNALRQGVPRNPDGSLNFGAMVDMMARAGNLGAVKSMADLASSDAMHRAQIQNMQANQGFRGREVSLAERQAQEKPQIQKVKDANGEEVLVRVTPQGQVTRLDTGTGGAPANPFSTGKMTEAQSKDSLYARRALSSEKILRETEDAGRGLLDRGLAQIPVVGNFAVSQKYQNFDQARRDFVNAVLRRESGAVISPAEFANAEKQYFPQPGDSKETVAQKRRNRQEAISGIAAGAGPTFRPAATFNQAGELVPNTAPARQQSQHTQQAQQQTGARPRARNPQTGQVVEFNGSAWVPVQ